MTDEVTTSASAPAVQATSATLATQGNTGASAPDFSNIPEDVIKSHPLYKQVLTESIERRKEIAELKKGATAPSAPSAPSALPASTAPTDPMQAALDRIAKLENALAESSANALRTKAASEAGLPANLASRIVGTSYEDMLADAQEIASVLPKAPATPAVPATPATTVPPSGTPGNAAGNQRDTTMLSKITQRMGSNFGVSSPFDPGVQRQVGGGAVSSK